MNSNIDGLMAATAKYIPLIDDLESRLKRIKRRMHNISDPLKAAGFALLFYTIQEDAISLEELVVEATKAIVSELARIQQREEPLHMSQTQMSQIQQLVELCNGPMFPTIHGKSIPVRAIHNEISVMRDC